ncbi:MAG TPA: alpha/beta fold hydrolase [Chloroflexota bacterium]|nr:alpha/beta fold hydrolase [Chloroflexota bacterium]
MAGEYVSKGDINGYLVRVPGATAGMLLLPHVTGIEEGMHHDAQTFADAGFTTFVWDPYPGFDLSSGKEPPRCVDDTVTGNQAKTIDWMLSELGVQRVGLVGWCMGGRMALNLAARERRLAVAVAYYPSIREPRRAEELDTPALVPDIRCPLQVVYPGKDHVTSNATFQRLREALDRSPAPKMILQFPDAVHGFLSRMGEAEANRQAGELAWPQTMAFVGAALKA